MDFDQNSNGGLYSLWEDGGKKDGNYEVIFHDGIHQYKLNHLDFSVNTKRVFDSLKIFSTPKELIGCLCLPNVIQPVLILSILKSSSAFTFIDPKAAMVSLCNLQKYFFVRTILAEDKTLTVSKLHLCNCWKTMDHISVAYTYISVLQWSNANCNDEKCSQYRKRKRNPQCNQELAYVVQTSGTTGEPKIVQVPHHCIVPNIMHIRSLYGACSNDVILLVAPLTFDPSIVDIFLSFVSSATLVIVPDSVKMIPKKLAQVIAECRVSILQATPSLFQRFDDDLVQQQILSKNTSLRILSLGGEKCPPINKLRMWKSKENETVIFNLYGISELSCWATYEMITFSKEFTYHDVPLGKSLLDTEIEIRNEDNEIIQDGHGILFIGGKKRWCVIDDELWPSGQNRIMRSTGDFVYKNMSGEIFFEGREDSVIKYNGKKVSLGKLSEVIEGVQPVIRHSLYFDHETMKLYAFLVVNYVYKREEEIRCTILRRLKNIASDLPVVEIVFTPFIPVTPHGKSDHKKLLSYAISNRKRKCMEDKESSVSSVEKYFSWIWKEYTGCKSIGIEDNFILNGGDSVSAVQCALEIEWKFQISVPNLVDMFLNSTFKKTCSVLKDCLDKRTSVCLKKEESRSSSPDVRNSLSVTQQCKSMSYDSYQSKSMCLSDITCIHNSKSLYCKMSSRRGSEPKCNCLKCLPLRSTSEPNDHRCNGLFMEKHFKYDLKKCIDATACCYEKSSDNMIAFIGSHSGYFVAVNIQTGSIIWEKIMPGRIESSASISSCGFFLVVGCYDSHLYCLDAVCGDLKWKYKTNAEIKCSPLILPNQIAYVGSHDQHFYAVNICGGNLIWKTKFSNGSIFSSPCYSSDPYLICVATLDGIIVALNPDSGDVIWQYVHGNPIFSSPVIVNSSVFIGSVNGSMLHLEINGNLKASFATGGPVFSSAQHFIQRCEKSETMEDYIVFGSHDCMVYCYSTCGINQWTFRCGSPVFATPFPFSRAGKHFVAICCIKGVLYILSALDGIVIFSIDLPGEVFSSPVVLSEYLIVGCRDNNIYCFKIL